MCECAQTIDEKLKEAGKDYRLKRLYGVNDAELELTAHLAVATEMLETTPTGKIKDGPMIQASFCPFCGREWSLPSTKKKQHV